MIFPNPHKLLLPGMFVRVRLDAGVTVTLCWYHSRELLVIQRVWQLP
nr:hypothetical protein [Candidatus Hamiltonella defensa]